MTETFPSSTPASAMPLVRLNAVKLAFDEGRVIALNEDADLACGWISSLFTSHTHGFFPEFEA